jgi:hypothetical protein
MNTKPSLYATLPVGTIIDVNTGWSNTCASGGDVYRRGEVLEDRGEKVAILIDFDGYGRPAQIKTEVFKSRIVEIVRGPLAQTNKA